MYSCCPKSQDTFHHMAIYNRGQPTRPPFAEVCLGFFTRGNLEEAEQRLALQALSSALPVYATNHFLH